MQARRALASLATLAGLVLVIGACVDRGPVTRRVLSGDDTDPDDFVAMSPSLDGRRVAYVSMTDGSVHVRDLGTGEVRQLVGGLPAVWHSAPTWSPDGRRVAVATTAQESGATSLELIDVATHAVEVVSGTPADREHGLVPVAWSRDGRSLLCVRGHDLVLVALGEGTITTVADNVRPDEGSLSPDGRFVAYATRGDGDSGIFVSPVAGGAGRLITTPGARGANPLWSPSGDAIAYESGGGIWVVPVREGAASGVPRQALVTGSITLRGWTRHGLYYTAWGESEQVPYQIRMNPAAGEAIDGEPEPLPGRHPDGWLGSFAWSPDMERVAFSHWHPAAVSVYSARQGTLRRFDVGGQGYAELPSWTADGREVLVHVITPQVPGADTVRAVDLATGQVRDREPRIPNGFYASYSADGRTVAFARQASSVFTRWQIGDIVVAATGAGDGRVVANGEVGEPIVTDPGPRLSPPGDRVLYVRQDRRSDPPGPASLWVVRSDGRGAQRLATAARIRSMAWDPGGRFVAYMATEATADSSVAVLRVVEVETGTAWPIPLSSTFAQDAAVRDWSRDGTLLGLVASTQLRSNEYWVVRRLSGGER